MDLMTSDIENRARSRRAPLRASECLFGIAALLTVLVAGWSFTANALEPDTLAEAKGAKDSILLMANQDSAEPRKIERVRLDETNEDRLRRARERRQRDFLLGSGDFAKAYIKFLLERERVLEEADRALDEFDRQERLDEDGRDQMYRELDRAQAHLDAEQSRMQADMDRAQAELETQDRRMNEDMKRAEQELEAEIDRMGREMRQAHEELERARARARRARDRARENRRNKKVKKDEESEL